MTNDETQQADAEVKTEGTVETEATTETHDYQGKLNATNRFLQKEGYEWKDGKWHKNPVVTQTNQSSSKDGARLSDDDIIFLAAKQLDGEDRAEVLKVAKAMNMTAEAAHIYLKPVLDVKAEERRSAAATQGPKTAAAGESSSTLDALQEKARKGNLSETELGKLVELEFASKKK